jgi:two-component system CheB/CheR fusion protein
MTKPLPNSADAPVPQPQPEEQRPPLPFLVVGVGGSSGGLEAFREMLENVPPEPGICFLFVQHLQTGHKSLLVELLQKATPMTVLAAQEDLELKPDHVYVINPDTDMAIHNGRLVLTARAGRRGLHMPVDHLFRSLADDQKSRAVGVVLSGGGTDGTLGLNAIKAEGGITFAQDDKSARQDSMPRSAIAEGCVDYVLPPAEIAHQLIRIARHPYTVEGESADAADTAAVLDKILSVLRANTEVDFSRYKRSTILRRVRRRMALRGLETMADYLPLLQNDPAEVQNLYQDFLIRVTRFFRDEEVFTALNTAVFPALIQDRAANNPIRIWVAACSTGEEVYSLAIALLEFLGERHLTLPIKILATDVNESALIKARSGMFVDNIELDVSPERLRRFFAKVNGHYQISKVVRDLCVFSRHDLTNDPPFSHLDLVSCRNVLIYLDNSLQKRVLPVLHYALNPGGFLLLGSSETIGNFSELFSVVDQKYRIYSKNGVLHPMMPLDFGSYVQASGLARRESQPIGTVSWSSLEVQKEADRIVLARYAPVGVVIDDNMIVLQFRGRTGPYLEPSPGTASLDLLKMLREGLLTEVRSAITRAKAESISVRRDHVPMRDKDRFRLVNIEIIPIKVPPSGARCFVVLFQDAPEPAEGPAPAAATPDEARQVLAEQHVQQLQQELSTTREYLQSLIEEHESACEELKSASEELLSSNEELQSTNEEMQTAKEETQSANEELATLNDELHHRNLDLAMVNNDLINLLSAVQIPIVLVSRDLRIRRFTPMAEKVLNLIPTDVGRPISDIKPNLSVSDLSERIAQVSDTLAPHEAEVQDTDGRMYVLRIRPYVTLDSKIDGASVTLLDVDSLKRCATEIARPPTAESSAPTGDGEAGQKTERGG